MRPSCLAFRTWILASVCRRRSYATLAGRKTRVSLNFIEFVATFAASAAGKYLCVAFNIVGKNHQRKISQMPSIL